jgi:hypothetical protein
VFWGGCVVFWCSFWVGFWLSESLRGVFTPARNGRLQGAHCSAPCSAFPLSRRRERGTKGVRAIQRTCWFTLALGKIAPASKTSCRTDVPLPAHPQPLSHSVGEGCRGALQCALQRVPPLPQAGEGDKGGEGNTARLPVHACAGKNSPCLRDSLPNRCTLIRTLSPLIKGGEGREWGDSARAACEFCPRDWYNANALPRHTAGEGLGIQATGNYAASMLNWFRMLRTWLMNSDGVAFGFQIT